MQLSRSIFVLGFICLVAAVLQGCIGRAVNLKPGRDAYYQVVTQAVPAQASGSHSQTTSLDASAPGSVGASHLITSTIGSDRDAANALQEGP